MKQKLIAGNWKMNGSLAANEALVHGVQQGLAQALGGKHAQVAVCVPAAYLSQVQQLVKGSGVDLGSQDVSAHEQGAYTGEISAAMLKDFAVRYAIVGHSERRQYHQEADEQVAEKALQVLDSDMIPVICVGESADERNSGRAQEVVCGQIAKQVSVLQDRLADCLIAYEPVWAIGTGKVASADIAQDMHRHIRLQLAEFDLDVASHVGILYGGSVNPDNAVELFAMPDIDGGLVGGASLNPQDFLAICQA